MPPSRRTGAARPVAKPATPPSIPQSTQASASAMPRPAAPAAPAAPHGAAPMGAPPPAMAPPPAQAPAMAQGGGGGGILSGIAGTVVQGMAFGTGSAVANRAVDAVMGPRQVEHVHQNAPAPAAAAPAAVAPACANEFKSFQECVSNAGGDVSACQFYMDMLNQCKTNFPSA